MKPEARLTLSGIKSMVDLNLQDFLWGHMKTLVYGRIYRYREDKQGTRSSCDSAPVFHWLALIV